MSLRRPMPREIPLIATVLVALWVVSAFAWVVHVGQHAHCFCPEHSTFEEAEGLDDAWPPATDSGQEEGLRSGAPWTGAGPSGNAHEACQLVVRGARMACTIPVHLPGLVLVFFPRVPLLPEWGTHPFEPLTVLVRAPKASPPAAA
jgi:hypothetical protein